MEISPSGFTGHCGPHSVFREDIEDILVECIIICAMEFSTNEEGPFHPLKISHSLKGETMSCLLINNHSGKK